MVSHFGLIPDGNRRWAVNNNLDLRVAYSLSMKHVEEIIDRAFFHQIRCVSVYMLSTENLKRKREDLDAVIEAENNLCISLIEKCRGWQCKVIHAGLLDYLPATFSESIKTLCDETASFAESKLNILIGYNPIDEINQALKKKEKIDISDLWVSEKLDLVVRTGGGHISLSNFLPIQAGYAQCVIVNKLFNDFSINDFDELLQKSLQVNLLNGK